MLMYRGANEELDPDLVHLVTEFDAVVLFDPPLRFAEALLDFLERGPARPRLYWNPGGLLANSPWTRTRLACADVVIMNRVETRDAVGAVNESLLERFSQQRRGFRLIETMGREGSRLHAAGRTTAAASYAAKVIDETGAGDAFTAAFAAFDALDFDELVSLKLANAAGACAIEGLGARVAQPDLATLIGRWNLFGELSALLLSRGSYLGIAAV